jgi:GT2 family glycosyltransferase
MSIKFEIIIPTKQNLEQYNNSIFSKRLQSIIVDSTVQADLDFSCSAKPVLENTTSLSDVYQDVLDNTEADYVILMHDDLEIHDHFLFKKLLAAHEQFDIVGLAGATSQNYNTDKPLAWHICMKKQTDGRGFVSHNIPKGTGGYPESYINSAYFGPTPSPVVFIDGLFMSFKVSSLKKGVDVFDREFTFHHYDLALACKAYEQNLKIGVWPIFAIHHSMGEFIDNENWQENAKRFKKKYGHISYQN